MTEQQEIVTVLCGRLGLEATDQVKTKVRRLIQELQPVPSVPFVPAPVIKNNADLAIERAKARTPGWEQNVERKMQEQQGRVPVAQAAPPTNGQRAAYIAHQMGTRAFARPLEEILDRLEALENVNVEQAHRISDLQLAAHARRKTT